MMNINKMETIGNFYKECKSAKEGLKLLRPEIYNKSFRELKRECDNANFRMAFLENAAKYICYTCPSCKRFALHDLEFIIAEAMDNSDYLLSIGDRFIDHICAKIVWRMLND